MFLKLLFILFPVISLGQSPIPTPTLSPTIATDTSCFSADPLWDESVVSLTVNGISGKNHYAKIGDTITILHTWYYNQNGYCPGCITQVYVGIADIDSYTSCSGNFGNSYVGNKYLTFTTTIMNYGCLTIFRASTLDYQCDHIYSGQEIGKIFVQGPSSPSFYPSFFPTYPPTTALPTGQPTGSPTSIMDTFDISSRLQSCYATCSYKYSRDVSYWNAQSYCTFFESTGCTAYAVSQYSCLPSCLSSCVDIYCSSFATLSYGCGVKIDTELTISEITSSCNLKSVSTAQSRTRAYYNSTIAIGIGCSSDTTTTTTTTTTDDDPYFLPPVNSYASLSLSSKTSSSLSYVIASTLKLTRNSTVTVVSTSSKPTFSPTLAPAKAVPSVVAMDNPDHRQLEGSETDNPDQRQVAVVNDDCIQNVTFRLNILSETLGYSSNSIDALTDYVSTTLSTSVSSGTFISDVHKQAVATEDPDLINAVVTGNFQTSTPVVDYIATLSPTTQPTKSPTQAPSLIYERLKITSHVQSCYESCSYKGSKAVTYWSNFDYCSFYDSTGCTAEGVAGYSCEVPCLSSCADVYCSTFSILSLGCNSESNYNYKGTATNISTSCLSHYSTSAVSKTIAILNTTIALTGISSSTTLLSDFPIVESYATLSLKTSSVLTSVIKTILALSKNCTVTVTSVSNTYSSTTSGSSSNSGIIGYFVSSTLSSQNVTFTITILVEELGYNTNSIDALYTYVSSTLAASATSGEFVTDVQTLATAEGVTALENMGIASSFATTAPLVQYLSTLVPTVTPTVVPTTIPTIIPTSPPTKEIPGCPIQLFLEDSYGDGWNGAIFVATNTQLNTNIENADEGLIKTDDEIDFSDVGVRHVSYKGYYPKSGIVGAKLSLVIKPNSDSIMTIKYQKNFPVAEKTLQESWEIIWGFTNEESEKTYIGSSSTEMKLHCHFDNNEKIIAVSRIQNAYNTLCESCRNPQLQLSRVDLGLGRPPPAATKSYTVTITLHKYTKDVMDSLSALFYTISDRNRINVIAHGSLCYNHTIESCGEDLDDGQYIFRTGSLWTANGSWEFCNTHGNLHTELIFVIMGDRCRVIDRKVNVVTIINGYTKENDYSQGDIKSEENNNYLQTTNMNTSSFDMIYSGVVIASLILFILVIILSIPFTISKNIKRILLETTDMDNTMTSTAGLMTSLKVNINYDDSENKCTSPYVQISTVGSPQKEVENEYESIDGTETNSITGIQLSVMSTSRVSEGKEIPMDPLTEESSRRRQTTAGLEVLFEKSALVPPLPII